MRIDLPQPRKEWLTRRVSQSLFEKHFLSRFYYPPTKLRSKKRLTTEQVLKHKWPTGKMAMDIDLLSDFVENFDARRTFGRAVEV
ncbi:7027_t:CDS:2, partial [Ambispora leptoticha]